MTLRRSCFACLPLLLAACTVTPPQPSEPTVALSQSDTSRLLAATLRYWIGKHPLPPRVPCYVFVQDGDPDRRFPSLGRQVPGQTLIVRYGSEGNTPPHPYFSLFVGHTSTDHAFVVVGNTANSAIVELRRQGRDWAVVGERPDIIT
jgi:hypothetical protein